MSERERIRKFVEGFSYKWRNQRGLNSRHVRIGFAADAAAAAVLETLLNLPMNVELNGGGSATLRNTELDRAIDNKIAALRKELEG